MIKNRILEIKTITADEVQANPANWRTHPQSQRDALRGILSEVGIVAPVIAYHSERNGGLTLIDGHERMTVGVPFPCAIVDVTDAEADVLLASFDPLTAMAEADSGALDALLREVSSANPAVMQMWADLAEREGVVEPFEGTPVDPADLWKGMPEFEQEDLTPYKSLLVHFANEEDYQTFADLIDQTLTPNTKSVWYPEQSESSYIVNECADEP